MKKLKYPTISFIIALTLLIFFMHFVGWRKLFLVYRNANTPLIFFALVLSTYGFILSAHVWKTILNFLNVKIPFWKIIELFYMSLFANYVTPFGQAGGEPFMAYIVSKESKISYGRGLAVIMSSDVLSAMIPILFGAIGLVYFMIFGNMTAVLFKTIIALALIGILIVVGIIILQTHKEVVERLALTFTKIIQVILKGIRWNQKKIKRYFSNEIMLRRIDLFYETFHSVIDKKRWELLYYTSVATLAQVLALYYSVLALGAKPEFLTFLAVLPLASLSSYLPFPGGLGSMEISITVLLISLCDLPLGVASGAALLYRFITYWIPLGVGGILSIHMVRKKMKYFN